jgi:hypothetical protein
MPTHKVRDGKRLITFDGDLLARVTSRRDGDASRWTEMSVYRTEAGTYVLEKVGRSVLMHVRECSDTDINTSKLPRFQDVHPGDDPDFGYEFHSCVPEEYDFTKLLVEEDRYWSTIAEDPEKIVDALYRKKDGERHMPRTSLDLLEAAGEHDRALRDAYATERIA